MKIKDGYILNKLGDKFVVIYSGEDINGLHGMINLNSTGAFIWSCLESGCTKEELLKSVTDKYSVTSDIALKDIEKVLSILISENILDE